MDHYKLYDGEFKFISVIWDAEPVNSTELVRLCADKLGWKKSTTYTMLKRMSERGLLQNTDTIVTARIGREQVRQYETETLLNKHFDGSVPTFVASFLQGRKLTEAEAREIQALIDTRREDDCNG
jgi:predicted transcriptional regulator